MSFIDRFIPESFQSGTVLAKLSLFEQVRNVAARLAFAAVAVFVLVTAAAFAIRLVLAN